jgi:hypothetical protein
MLSAALAADARRAFDRGLRYVLEAQRGDGAWTDFELDGTESDAWVTAYVGVALHGARDLAARPADAALARARTFLETSFGARGGWGFNTHAPIDADSTAWATVFLAHGGGAPTGAYASLRRHRRDDGGFSCYERYSDPSTWRISHADVSAVVMKAFLTEPARDGELVERCAAYLREAQLPDGSWPSFWYATRLYSVLHVLDALAELDPESLAADRYDAATRFASSAALPGDAFSIAPAAEIAARFAAPELAREPVEQLLALQRVDGRWTAGEPFMLPDPWNYVGDEGNAGVFDQYGLFTTATVLRAFGAVLRGVSAVARAAYA